MTGARLRMVLLIGSLCLNLFLGGIFLGRWFTVGPPPGPLGGMLGGVREAVADLPPDLRETVHGVVEHHRPEIRSRLMALHESRRAVHAALAAEEFDREAAVAAFAELRARTEAIQFAVQAAVIDAAEQLPSEARIGLAASAGRGGMGRPPHHGGGPRPPQ